MHQPNTSSIHIPVLVAQVLSYLSPMPGESYLDMTAGYGGHAAAVLAHTRAPDKLTLVDRDHTAIKALSERFDPRTATITQADFLSATTALVAAGAAFDMILADLGVSSLHLDTASRGFAFRESGPLDMRMDQAQPLQAADIVNTYDEHHLASLLRQYGEEPRARKIAALIVANRPFATTDELAAVIKQAYPGRSKVHPATRSFQALRIAVNDELGQLEQSLTGWLQLLKPGGRLAVISFHSLEDRIVKQTFADAAGDRYDADLRLLTKRPATASQDELVLNPRARSAKLRAVAKINTEREAHANSGKKHLPSL